VRVMPWLVAALAGGVMVYLIGTGKLDFDGKFLGLVPDSAGFGLDDIAKGAAIVGGAFLLGKLANQVTGGAVPVGAKI
jgi:hypothetical protein